MGLKNWPCRPARSTDSDDHRVPESSGLLAESPASPLGITSSLRAGGSLRLPLSLRETIGQRAYGVKTRDNPRDNPDPAAARNLFIPGQQVSLPPSPRLFFTPSSLVSQGYHGVDLGGAARGDVAGEQRGQQKYGGD
jgi:hypothetical protein